MEMRGITISSGAPARRAARPRTVEIRAVHPDGELLTDLGRDDVVQRSALAREHGLGVAGGAGGVKYGRVAVGVDVLDADAILHVGGVRGRYFHALKVENLASA